MDVSLATVGYALVASAVTAFCVAWLNWVWLKPNKLEYLLRRQGFSGNRYRLLKGDDQDRLDMEKKALSCHMSLSSDISSRVSPFLLSTVRKYGRNSFVWVGPVPFVNITQPDSIGEVFTKHYEIKKANSNPLIKLLAEGLANHEGQKWANHRRIITPAFHMANLKSMMPIFVECCELMISKLEAERDVDMWLRLQELSCDTISRAAFGSHYEEGTRIFELLKLQSGVVSQVIRSTYIPGWRTMRNLDKEIKALIYQVISKREKALAAGDEPSDDIIGLLIHSNKSETKQELKMTMNDVMEECKLFYLAGQETTSAMLVWTMVMLAMHPRWQDTARKEVFDVFGEKTPDFDNLCRLKKIPMIFNEVLRLYPPVANLTRAVDEDVTIGNLVMPGGVHLNLPAILVHRDVALWGADALEFNPERFAGGVSSAAKQFSFFPFGAGPRNCIGQRFSLLNAKLALCMILQRFWFELSSEYVHAPRYAVTIQPQHGALIFLHNLSFLRREIN